MSVLRPASRSCTGKKGYHSKADAKSAIRRLMADGKHVGNVQAYCCHYCGYYHFGHRPDNGWGEQPENAADIRQNLLPAELRSRQRLNGPVERRKDRPYYFKGRLYR